MTEGTHVDDGATLTPNTRYYVTIHAPAGAAVRVFTDAKTYVDRTYDEPASDDLEFFETGDDIEGAGRLRIEPSGGAVVAVTSQAKTESFESL